MKNLNYNLLLKIPLLKIPHYKKQIEKINNSQNKNINLINCFDDEIKLNYEKYLKSIQNNNNNNNNNNNKINIPLLKTEKISKKKRIFSFENNNFSNNNFSNNNNNNSTITTTAFYSTERGNKHKKIINDLLSLSYKNNKNYFFNKNDVYNNYKTLEHNLNNKNKKKRIFSYDFLNNNNNNFLNNNNNNFLSKSQLFSHSIEYKNNINEICNKIDKNCLKTKKIFEKHKKHYRILSVEDFKRIELKKELGIKKIKKNNPYKNAQLFKESDVIFNLNDDFVFKNNKIIKNIMNNNKNKKFENKNNNKNNIEKMMFKTKYLIRINKEKNENIKNRTNKFFEQLKKK